MTNTELYGNDPNYKIQQHRPILAGHSYRNAKEPVSQLITWSLNKTWKGKVEAQLYRCSCYKGSRGVSS